jgi:Flp pilus assembly protein TadG
MRTVLALLKRFRSDERGAFAMIFAALAIVLVATSGAVVDYTSVEQARTRAQVALDAAALALQPQIYTAGYDIKGKAQAVLLERLADGRGVWNTCAGTPTPPCGSVDAVATDTTNGTLTLTGKIIVPMNFVSLVGVSTMTVAMSSQATRKKLNQEIALVLDNSGSMSTSMSNGSSRMVNLKADAICATNILFYNVSTCTDSIAGKTANPQVKFGLVPFTLAVNVGPGNASAAWLDRSGNFSGSITRNNFDSDDNESTPFAGSVDRIALFSGLRYNGSALSWGGCVEARKSPYDTTDDPPVAGTDTVFTPYFAPDEPDSGYSNSYISDTPSSCLPVPSCIRTQVRRVCNSSNFDTASCTGSSSDSIVYTNSDGSVQTPAPTSCPSSSAAPSVADTRTSTGSGSNKVYDNTRTTSTFYPFSSRVLQERLCKYTNTANPSQGISLTSAPNQGSVHGPNGDCPANAILPLTATPATVVSGINSMAPQGGTNIHEGVAWGFRVLSPSAPFTEAQPYGQITSKVLIVMTDGENTIYPGNNMNGATYYDAYAFPYNARMGNASWTTAQFLTEMNARTVATCNNAKAAGIKVYTIGLAVSATSNPTANTQMLTNCASDSGKAFFPTSTAQLEAAFTSIAKELAQLRLSQ